jgi:hypothetical protein
MFNILLKWQFYLQTFPDPPDIILYGEFNLIIVIISAEINKKHKMYALLQENSYIRTIKISFFEHKAQF